MANILYANQYFTTTLNVGGGINDSQTTGIILSDVSGVDTSKPGIVLVNYSDPLNTTLCEWIEYSSINGSKELQGVVRGSEGFSAKSHSNGVTVAFPLSESHINRIADMLTGVDSGAYLRLARVTPRTNTVASSATPSINTDTTDIFTITALATAITSMTTNLTGTPVNGQKLVIRIKDDGTARAITWGASFASRGATLPTTTTLSKYTYIELLWNSTASVWDCIYTTTEDSGSGTSVSFSARRSTNQSISASTYTKINHDTESWDTNSNYDNATNYRFTPTVAGKYLVIAAVRLTSVAAGKFLYSYIYKNGTVAHTNELMSGSTNTQNSIVTAIIDMNGSTDYIEHYTWTDQVSPVISSTADLTYFQASKIG